MSETEEEELTIRTKDRLPEEKLTPSEKVIAKVREELSEFDRYNFKIPDDIIKKMSIRHLNPRLLAVAIYLWNFSPGVIRKDIFDKTLLSWNITEIDSKTTVVRYYNFINEP